MTTYTYKDLIAAPIGILFQEIEVTSEPIYIKVGNSAGKYKNKDILVESLFDCYDGSASRMGFAECDESDLNSREFCILSASDLKGISEKIQTAIIRRAQMCLNQPHV